MDISQLPGVVFRRWMYVLVPAVLFVLLAAAYITVVKPTVPVTAEILIDPQGLATEAAKLTPDVAASNQDAGILESQIYVLQSTEMLGSVVDKLDLTNDPFLYKGPRDDMEMVRAATVGALQKHLTVEREGQSYVLLLTFKHVDPKRGAEITNALAQVYLKKIHEARSDASQRASGAFEVQADTLASRMRKAETELEKFKAANNLVSTGQQGLVIDQQVEGVNKQLIAARADLGAKMASYEQAKTLTVGSIEAGAIPEALSSTALGQMRARYADIVANADQLASQLGTNHPQLQSARSQVEGMRQAIEQELSRIRRSLQGAVQRGQSNVKSLEARLAELTRSSIDSSEAGIKARELQSEVDTLRALYKAFLSRSEELGQRQTVNINNSRIISKAVGAGSTSMLAKLLIVIAAGLFGIALGSGLAVLREIGGNMMGKRVREEDHDDDLDEAEDEDDVSVAPTTVVPAASERLPLLTRLDVAHAAQRLIEGHVRGTVSTVLLLASEKGHVDDDVLPQLASALFRQNYNVLFSDGEKAIAYSDQAPYLPANYLRFEKMTRQPKIERSKAPTFRNFADPRIEPDFVIIDSRGLEARRHIEDLLSSASSIFVLSSGTDVAMINGVVSAYDPWKERMLGAIQVDRAA